MQQRDRRRLTLAAASAFLAAVDPLKGVDETFEPARSPSWPAAPPRLVGSNDLAVAAVARRSLANLLGGLPLAAGLLLWVLSLPHVHVGALGRDGLIPALPIIWYAAVGALVVGGAATAWSARASGWLKAAYVAALVAVLYATVPAVADVPTRAWVYKHIGTADALALHGGVDAAAGNIYDRWPGFFALAASFSSWAHLGALSFAAWAEPFFALVDAAMVGALGFAFGGDARVAAFAALVFTISDWVGEAYFAPQAVAFLLALGLLLVFVRALDARDLRPRLSRLVARLAPRRPQSETFADSLPWSPTVAAAVVVAVAMPLVATHQLTPYALLLQLFAFWAVGVTRARRPILLIAALTVAYLVPNLGYLRREYGLFRGFRFSVGVQDVRVANLAFLQANAPRLLSGALAAMMLVAAVRVGRRGYGRRAAALVALGVAPLFSIALGQQYGGNGPLRFLLFCFPVWSVLVALGIATIARAHLRQIAALLAAGLLAALFVPAFYGREELNIVQPGEVRASQYFYAHAPAGSVLLVASPPFPGEAGARYTQMVGPTVDDQLHGTLLGSPRFQHRSLGSADVPAVVSALRAYSPRAYVVFATSGYRFAALTRLAPPGALADLEAAIRGSSSFRLWYSSPAARIYRLTPTAVGSGSSR